MPSLHQDMFCGVVSDIAYCRRKGRGRVVVKEKTANPADRADGSRKQRGSRALIGINVGR